MATDGTKIIDGDTAHDVYNGIMDLYDSEATTEMILKEFPLKNPEYQFDDFEYEIYVTACGLAYWEIGLMTEKRLEYIKKIIEKNACVKVWTEEYSEKMGKSRKSILKRYLTKISKENEKIRKPKKYKKITNLLFEKGDILVFQISTGEYYALYCVRIEQYRGVCEYDFGYFTYKSLKKPTLEDIKESEILGRFLEHCSDSLENIQKGIRVLWDFFEFSIENQSFGFSIDAIDHKDILNYKDKFEKIGNIQVRENYDKTYSYGGTDFEEIDRFMQGIEKSIIARGYYKVPFSLIIEE